MTDKKKVRLSRKTTGFIMMMTPIIAILGLTAVFYPEYILNFCLLMAFAFCLGIMAGIWARGLIMFMGGD